MELMFYKYIDDLMQKAEYGYDKSEKVWFGSVKNFPGVYAQGKSVEEVRNELITTLEDYLLLDLKEKYSKMKIPGFFFGSRYAKAN